MEVTYDNNVIWNISNQENMSELNDNDTVVFKKPDKIKTYPDIQIKKPNIFIRFINRIRNYISPAKKTNINELNRQFIDELSLHNSIRTHKPNGLEARGSILKSITGHFGIALDENSKPIDSSIDPYHGRVNPASPWH
jgi:hypothetical protein